MSHFHPSWHRRAAALLWLTAALLLGLTASLASSAASAATAATATTTSSTGSPRVKGLPAASQDPRAFPGSSAAAVRQQAAQCVVPQKLGVVYLIDDSGSMGGNDYEKLRASAVELGMREVGAAGVVAGIRFSDAASTIFGATDLTVSPAPAVDTIRASLKSLGGTAYSKAFAAAKAQLAAFPVTVDQKIVVLLSDGEPTDAFNAAAEVPALGARVYPIGFGSADNAQLAQIASLSGGLTQAVGSDQSTQGAISRAVASARCQPVDVPETFDLAPGQSRRVPFTIPPNQPSFAAIATWGKGAIDVTLQRPDGTIMAPGATNPTESLEVTATTARAAVSAPPAGTWTVILKAKQENVRKISVSIDLLGGGSQQHPMENEPSPLGEGCTTSFTSHGRVAWSRCFRAIKDGVESTEPVRIAGIDLTPIDGKPIRILNAGGRLEADNVEVSVFARTPIVSGSVPLYGGRLVLPLDRNFLFKGDAKSSVEVTRPNRSIAALPIRREPGFELAWTPTGAKLTLSLDISRQFEIVLPPRGVDQGDGSHTLKRGYGLEVTLATSNEKGIALDYVGGRIDQAKLFGGKLFLKNLFLNYSADKGILTGGGAVELFRGPLAAYALPTISASLGLQLEPFDFASFEAEVSNINKPIGPYVYLQKVGGSISKLPPPWAVEGTTEVTLGPKFDIPLIGNVSAVSVSGSAKWQYPATISGAVDLKLFNQQTSNATIEANLLEPEAKLSATTSITLAGSGFEGNLDGWLSKSALLLSGGAKVKIAGFNVTGGDAFVSSTGIGACARWIGPDYGWRLRWGDKLPKVMGKSCDFGDLDEVGKKSQVGGASSTQIGKNSRGELLQIVGTGGAPLGTVRGPDGTAVEIGVDRGFVETPNLVSVPDPSTNSVYVVLAKPAAGTWTVEPRPGSAPLAITGRAQAKPEAQVKVGKLRRSGSGYRLSYSVKRAKGEQLVLVQRGPGGRTRKLLTTSRTKGTVRFDRLEGAAGERVIEASVRSRDGERLRTIVGRYTAKNPVRPGKVRALKLRRSGSVVRLSWKAPLGGKPARYSVVFRTKDGRQIVDSVKRPQAIIDGLAGKTSGKVSVIVVGKSGLESTAALLTPPKTRQSTRRGLRRPRARPRNAP